HARCCGTSRRSDTECWALPLPPRQGGGRLQEGNLMLDFIARRLVAIIPVLTVVAVLVFLILPLTPGDPAAVSAGDNATSDQTAAICEKLGLELPIWQQFGIWIGDILRGNFGESFFFKKTVTELIAQRIEPTLALSICTMIIALSISLPLGV